MATEHKRARTSSVERGYKEKADDDGEEREDASDHKRGDWHCHFYVPVPEGILDPINLSTIFPKSAKPHDKEALHISLSRQFTLASHEIEPVNKAVTSLIRTVPRFKVTVDTAQPIQLESEQNVKFGCFKVVGGIDGLAVLIDAVDDVLVKFGKEKYFDERIFHVSVCSWVGNDVGPLCRAEVPVASGSSHAFSVDKIFMRSGHRILMLPLQ